MASDLPNDVRELRRKILAITLEAERPLSFNALTYQLDKMLTDFRQTVTVEAIRNATMATDEIAAWRKSECAQMKAKGAKSTDGE